MLNTKLLPNTHGALLIFSCIRIFYYEKYSFYLYLTVPSHSQYMNSIARRAYNCLLVLLQTNVGEINLILPFVSR